ncbi:hypothetical protein AZE42_13917, partial [Rhizopogon vesiculosus]
MKVRWSSTCVMLRRAYELSEDVDYFIGQLALQERDTTHHKKITNLELSQDEWTRAQKLISILGVSRHIS